MARLQLDEVSTRIYEEELKAEPIRLAVGSQRLGRATLASANGDISATRSARRRSEGSVLTSENSQGRRAQGRRTLASREMPKVRPQSGEVLQNDSDLVHAPHSRRRQGPDGNEPQEYERLAGKLQPHAGLEAATSASLRESDTTETSPKNSDSDADNPHAEMPEVGIGAREPWQGSDHHPESSSTSSSSEPDRDKNDVGHAEDDEDDLVGLRTATKVAEAAERRKGRQKRKPGSADVITCEGAQADKLGVEFERVLSKASKFGVMEGSKSVQKRIKESVKEETATKASAVTRRERRSFGHVRVLPRGQDPACDATEKGYVTIATKGVVQLFNAITQAQKAMRHAELGGAKRKEAIKGTKDALLQVLQPQQKKPRGLNAEGGDKAPGWQVLREGYTGLDGNTKLKELDRAAEQEEDIVDELQDQEVSDEDFADW